VNTTSSRDIFDVIGLRRSVRSFKPDGIPHRQIEKLVEAAQWAPTPGNRQSWHFIAIVEPAALEGAKALSPGLPKSVSGLLVVCSDHRRWGDAAEEFARVTAIEEASMATENILLAASALALGACVVASFSSEGVAELLQLPPNIEPILLVGLGVPDEEPLAPTRRTMREILSWNTYKEECSAD